MRPWLFSFNLYKFWVLMPRNFWLLDQSKIKKYSICSQTLFCGYTVKMWLLSNILTWSRNAGLRCENRIHHSRCKLHGTGSHRLNQNWRLSKLCVWNRRWFSILRSPINHVLRLRHRTISSSLFSELWCWYGHSICSINEQDWSRHS